jgi:hypothetical protein
MVRPYRVRSLLLGPPNALILSQRCGWPCREHHLISRLWHSLPNPSPLNQVRNFSLHGQFTNVNYSSLLDSTACMRSRRMDNISQPTSRSYKTARSPGSAYLAQQAVHIFYTAGVQSVRHSNLCYLPAQPVSFALKSGICSNIELEPNVPSALRCDVALVSASCIISRFLR